MNVSVFDAQVFIGEHEGGNPARCYLVKRPPSRARCARLSTQSSNAVCFCWWQRGALRIRCFQHGKVVQFCGHGILASAYAWRSLQNEKRNGCATFPLICGTRHLQFFGRAGRQWLRTARIICVTKILPESIAAQCNPQPIAMAVAGDVDGYKVFEWPAGTDIAKVTVESELLLSDRRATILTAKASLATKAETGYDFTLRYLAPHYGNDEDVATGSANVVLADYWFQRGLVPPFNVRQCSPAGGAMVSDIEGDCIAIGGMIHLQEISADDYWLMIIKGNR